MESSEVREASLALWADAPFLPPCTLLVRVRLLRILTDFRSFSYEYREVTEDSLLSLRVVRVVEDPSPPF